MRMLSPHGRNEAYKLELQCERVLKSKFVTLLQTHSETNFAKIKLLHSLLITKAGKLKEEYEKTMRAYNMGITEKNASEEEGSEKSKSEVNDDDEDGDDEEDEE